MFLLRLELLVHSYDGVLGFLKNAIKAAQHGQRDHYPPVLRRSVGSAQEIGDVSNDVAVLLESVEVVHEMRLS